jgi:hypothetical protein
VPKSILNPEDEDGSNSYHADILYLHPPHLALGDGVGRDGLFVDEAV